MARSFLSVLGIFSLAGGFLIAQGCGGGETPSKPKAEGGTAEQSASGAPAKPQAENVFPENESAQQRVVRQFLEASQAGNAEVAQTMLTARSLANLQQQQVQFLPEKIDTGSFEIGTAQMHGNKVLVECVWKEFESGEATERIHWITKEEQPGAWKISGMMVHMEQMDEPLVIDFESDALGGGTVEETAAPSPTAGPAAQQAQQQNPFQQPPR